jgi:hypothetical protein
MSPEIGSKVIAIARGLIGSHYINGAYGATPGNSDGCPCRPGGVNLVADPGRLDPARANPENRNLAVLAAEMFIKQYCVCGGNYASMVPRGQEVSPTDPGLVAYLQSLKDKSPSEWPNYLTYYTPRRAYGPAQGGGLGGKLVLGQPCKGVRHFDCVGFISYCYWKASGNVVQLDISAWRTPNMAGKVYDLQGDPKAKPPIPPERPAALMDADIIIKKDHHIAFVDANGTIFEAQDTHLGVNATGHFSFGAPGWTHLVRVASGAEVPLPDWPLGWWKVWDGNTWYYYFSADGVVRSSKTAPHNTRTPPAQAHNTGRYTYSPPNTLVVTWNQVAGAPKPCQETFYNAASGCGQMNATSNLYSPLVATRLN